MEHFTHIDQRGHVKMVDVTEKKETKRKAVAYGSVQMKPQTLQLIKDGAINKGGVLETARIAGIMGVKRTAELIPMCHPLQITGIEINFRFRDEKTISIMLTVKTTGKTGVEMEALTGLSITALTIYDMCKAVDKSMVIGEIKLLEKTGGKSGAYLREVE